MEAIKLKFDKKSLCLYLVTDRAWLKENALADQIESAVKSGVTFVQLREKKLSPAEFIKLAEKIKRVAAAYQIPFVINDNIEVAMAIDADGIHVGQKDMSAREVRKMIGDDKILGVSAQTVEQALAAERCGADYLGVGAVFGTDTKSDAQRVSFDTLNEITRKVRIPVVAIGGINETNILTLKGSQIEGVAVVSAILAQPDICAATRNLKKLAEALTKGG
jgi:thiamine-phosphate pyrophosphorylase